MYRSVGSTIRAHRAALDVRVLSSRRPWQKRLVGRQRLPPMRAGLVRATRGICCGKLLLQCPRTTRGSIIGNSNVERRYSGDVAGSKTGNSFASRMAPSISLRLHTSNEDRASGADRAPAIFTHGVNASIGNRRVMRYRAAGLLWIVRSIARSTKRCLRSPGAAMQGHRCFLVSIVSSANAERSR